jgi:enediyne biosynthesis protein E3
MNGSVAKNMEYIQDMFLTVEQLVPVYDRPQGLISFLESEPEKYRSIAYESASMAIAFFALQRKSKDISDWKKFFESTKGLHVFHTDIGLGWAFGRADVKPQPYWTGMSTVSQCMIYDGIGYFNGLFKRRKTIDAQQLPHDMTPAEQLGFDQGLGRRLWYNNLGEVEKTCRQINAFPSSRRADLWRGLGIGCGYVGGNDQTSLHQLNEVSGEYRAEIRRGIALAAFSRKLSNTITPDIQLACKIICTKSFEAVTQHESAFHESLRHTEDFTLWMTKMDVLF